MRAIVPVVILLCALSTFAGATDRLEVEEVVDNYVGLYRAETLPQWKELFHPALTVAFATGDGDVRVRSLEEFYSAQAKGFAEGPMSERLDHVYIAAGVGITRVMADFVFTSEGKSAAGKLGLHLVRTKQGWKIIGIVFEYDK